MFRETITDANEKLRVFMDTDCSEILKVWYVDGNNMKNTGAIREFRLIYNLLNDAHCLLWRRQAAGGKIEDMYAHTGIDDGEDKCVLDDDGQKTRFPFKQSPTIVLNGVFEKENLTEIAEDFLGRARHVDQELARFIHDKLLGFPEEQFVHKPHK